MRLRQVTMPDDQCQVRNYEFENLASEGTYFDRMDPQRSIESERETLDSVAQDFESISFVLFVGRFASRQYPIASTMLSPILQVTHFL